jgi:hypothetical protein
VKVSHSKTVETSCPLIIRRVRADCLIICWWS